MPYEYRKMSPEERKEIVQYRKEMGFPYHSPPHPVRQAGFYLITAACFEHAPILLTTNRRDAFETRLLSSLKQAEIGVDAWVILLNHYHILIEVADFEMIPTFIQRLHNGTSYEWNREDGCTGQRRVWLRYVDRYIRDEAHYFQAMNYIHHNPVKHGYVDNAYQWNWSSLNLYFEVEGREWLRQTWKKYPPNNHNFDGFDGEIN
jgi:putative transposase